MHGPFLTGKQQSKLTFKESVISIIQIFIFTFFSPPLPHNWVSDPRITGVNSVNRQKGYWMNSSKITLVSQVGRPVVI